MAEKSVFKFKIIRHIAVLSKDTKTGWTKELNIVSFNGESATYDIRKWNPDHKIMSKGTTLTQAEMKLLLKALAGELL